MAMSLILSLTIAIDLLAVHQNFHSLTNVICTSVHKPKYTFQCKQTQTCLVIIELNFKGMDSINL